MSCMYGAEIPTYKQAERNGAHTFPIHTERGEYLSPELRPTNLSGLLFSGPKGALKFRFWGVAEYTHSLPPGLANTRGGRGGARQNWAAPQKIGPARHVDN